LKLIDGKAAAHKIERSLSRVIGTLTRPPVLAFVIVGSNPASHAYVRMKKKKGQELGIASKDKEFSDSVSQEELLAHIERLNQDPDVDGILVQLPLPKHISTPTIMQAVSPDKDVDGFHPLNVGKMLLGEDTGFLPCTPYGIVKLLHEYQIPVSGKHVAIIGRSNIVGKPLAAMLMQKKEGCNATVTLAHSQTKDLNAITRSADIVVAAIGHPHFVTSSMVCKGVVVIDVGISRVGSRLVGDVDFDAVSPLASAITPVPGGVGPMTIAMLMSNTVLSYERRFT